MKSKAPKKVKVEKIPIYDLNTKDFKFFKNFFETFITEDLIESERCEQISKLS